MGNSHKRILTTLLFLHFAGFLMALVSKEELLINDWQEIEGKLLAGSMVRVSTEIEWILYLSGGH